MTGGRRRRELIESIENGSTCARKPPPPLPFEEEATQALERWREGIELRERVEALLHSRRLRFSEWRMIHATEVLMRETGDMVSQQDIRRRACVSAATGSQLMFDLAGRGWLDYGPDYHRVAYRVRTTEKSESMLAATRPLVVQIARTLQGRRPKDAGASAEAWPKRAD